MVMPEVTRARPPRVAGEREMLNRWLDFHRATLLWKCQGLSAEQLRTRSCAPSTLTLLGLVRHMTDVEHGWFSDFAGLGYQGRYETEQNPDGSFDDIAEADPVEAVAAFEAECENSRQLAADCSLDDTYIDERGNTFSLRWIYVHMIEEYARHNGHADIIRERIDGVVGD
jgi:uncharacterized damage-inducible protein DinB